MINHGRTKPPAGTKVDLHLPACRGLLGAFLFNEGQGLTANNAVPGGPDGVLGAAPQVAGKPQGPTWYGSDWGTCLLFDPSSQACFVSVPLVPGRVFTYFIYATLWEQIGNPVLMATGNPASALPMFEMYLSNGALRLEMFARNDANNSLDKICPTVVAKGARTSYALVCDGTTLAGYVNGALDATGSVAGVPDPVTVTRLMIGNQGNNSPTFQWRGPIDLAYVWNRPLADHEVRRLHQSPFSIFSVHD